MIYAERILYRYFTTYIWIIFFQKIQKDAAEKDLLIPINIMNYKRSFLFCFGATAAAFTMKRRIASATRFESSSPIVSDNYEKLKSRLAEIEKLNGVVSLLGWDEMVMMTEGSATARNEQKSALVGVIYEKLTHPELGMIISSLEESDFNFGLSNDFQKALVRDAIRDFKITSRKTKEMATREAELEGKGYQAWQSARKSDSFKEFLPVLKDIVELKYEIALATQPELSAYDANIGNIIVTVLL